MAYRAGASLRRPGWTRKFLREVESGLVLLVWWHLTSLEAEAPAGALSELAVALWAGRLARDNDTGWLVTLPAGESAARDLACARASVFGAVSAAFPVSLKRIVDVTSSVTAIIHQAVVNDHFDYHAAVEHIDRCQPIVLPAPHSIATVTTTILAQPPWLDLSSASRHRRGPAAAAVGATAWRRARWAPAPWHAAARALVVAMARSRGRVAMA